MKDKIKEAINTTLVVENKVSIDRCVDKIYESIQPKDNVSNIMVMLHEFRNWNREWDLNFSHNPDSVDKFAEHLSKRFTIHINR